ncbi:hypothetical protein CCACVL1_03013 [Corchorus capsularis]|uniref:Carbohydrate kinase FGGY N-terminal domain-containing protein n=1 Tax=Corchorus capsularis TaxID=210143 RepID=A0A1R3K3S5_COCAP|nr:hypothetical protein CCACVL1_03013 [Corchorus capsularis]
MSKEEVFIGSIDQGNTSTRFILYDKSARPIGSHQVKFTQCYPEAGWFPEDFGLAAVKLSCSAFGVDFCF